MNKIQPLWSVAVFAHNEERSIGACLESIRAQSCPGELSVYVLANGCTDNTAPLVRKLAAEWPAIRLAEIEIGDKADAWNVFVHEIAPPSEVFFFVDGDVRVEAGAFARLAAKLRGPGNPFIVSAVPGSGRNARTNVDLIRAERGVQGNLYSASAYFIAQVQKKMIRIPVGFVRDDGFVGAVAKFDFNPRGKWRDDRVEVCEEARFTFDSISWCRFGDWRKYYHRRIRYSIGAVENKMLREVWRTHGIEGTPRDVQNLYRASSAPKLAWHGLNTWFEWLAIRRINAKRANAA